jgi:hypothetical protein
MSRQGGSGVRRGWVLVGCAAVVCAAATAPAAWGTTAPAATGTATVNVNTAQRLATVPAAALGINGSVYDGDLTDTAVPGLLHTAGVTMIRFPGGTSSDTYDWKTNTDALSGARQATGFDQYATLLSQTGARGMITVDYGTGDTVGAAQSPPETGAQFAADWVRYANVTHHDNIEFWEIGNEVYGNGTYGANWEPDQHCAAGANPANCGPAAYAQNVRAYVTAMKAVDPSIKIGVVLTAPGNWPDGQTSAGSPQPWNQTVLSALGNQIDFADVHWYPQNPSNVTPPGPSDAGLLAATAQIGGMVSALRAQLAQYAGNGNIPIDITETNSVSSNPGKQTVGLVNALYLTQDYLGWLSNGVASVDWWQIHNGMVTSGDNGSSLSGTANYGDYGVLSDATCGTAGSAPVCEPAADTPFPAYYGLDLLGQFIHPGDTLVTTTSSQSLVQAYAATAADGTLRVLLVNDDPTNAYTVGLGYTGFTPTSDRPAVATLAAPGTSITNSTAAGAASITVAPYSANVITIPPGTGSGGGGGGGGTCHVAYATQSQWAGGFTANVTLTNTGSTAWSTWQVGFTYPGDQKITSSWNTGGLNQSGQRVTATNASYNGTVAPGASTSFGVQGTWTASDAAPASFTVNGTTC